MFLSCILILCIIFKPSPVSCAGVWDGVVKYEGSPCLHMEKQKKHLELPGPYQAAFRSKGWPATAKAGVYSPVILPQNHLSTGISGLGFLTRSNGSLDFDYLVGKEVCNPRRPENLGIWLSKLPLKISEQPETV